MKREKRLCDYRKIFHTPHWTERACLYGQHSTMKGISRLVNCIFGMRWSEENSFSRNLILTLKSIIWKRPSEKYQRSPERERLQKRISIADLLLILLLLRKSLVFLLLSPSLTLRWKNIEKIKQRSEAE